MAQGLLGLGILPEYSELESMGKSALKSVGLLDEARYLYNAGRSLLDTSSDQADTVAAQTIDAPRPDTLLKKFENEELKGFEKGSWFPHKSIEGGTRTVGWGHKITADEKKRGVIKVGEQLVNFKNGMTPQQVNQLYEQDTAKARSIARKSLVKNKSDIEPNELQALTSLIYNVGQGAWAKSNAKKYLESGNIDRFLKEAFDSKIGFVKSNKKILKGLVDRRSKERNLFQGIM